MPQAQQGWNQQAAQPQNAGWNQAPPQGAVPTQTGWNQQGAPVQNGWNQAPAPNGEVPF